jgi:hypothetical protein
MQLMLAGDASATSHFGWFRFDELSNTLQELN